MGSLMAFGAVSSDAALAGSLLSGYGGPGQGNQAILGSALLNKPGGGSGSSGSGSSASSTSTGTGYSTSVAAGGEPANGSGSASRAGTHGKPRSTHLRGVASADPRGGQAGRSATKPQSIADVYAAAERGAPAPSSGALGLSGADLVLILLALGMLGAIAVLSRRLARSHSTGGPRPEGGG
jgi:hypothetical protein